MSGFVFPLEDYQRGKDTLEIKDPDSGAWIASEHHVAVDR